MSVVQAARGWRSPRDAPTARQCFGARPVGESFSRKSSSVHFGCASARALSGNTRLSGTLLYMIQVRAVCAPSATEAAVDADIRRFDEWFQGLNNDPLIRSEVAIIKTYLHYKLRETTNEAQDPSDPV